MKGVESLTENITSEERSLRNNLERLGLDSNEGAEAIIEAVSLIASARG